ncbi:MAG: response regulator [Desulfovibrio sp.]|jgi:signal transduction histidine kinase/ActR/RegA family two-component response regulator|nr:response regulator [Desulfovibrio sp.]
MRFPFRIGIHLFLGQASFLLALIFLIIAVGMLTSIKEMASLSSAVRQKSMPDILETQHIFISVENLRRFAEVVYVAKDPQVRRSARVDAQAMVAELALSSRDKDFYAQSRALVQLIIELENRCEAVSEASLYLQSLAREFALALDMMIDYVSDIQRMRRIFQAHSETSMFTVGSIDAMAYNRKLFEQQQHKDKEGFLFIRRQCEDHVKIQASLEKVCSRQQTLYDEYVAAQEKFMESKAYAHGQWEVVDGALREMLDEASSGSEFIVTDALTAIEQRAAAIDGSAVLVFVAGLLCLLFYLVILHWYIVRPIRWTARKLRDIQQGELYGPMPVIRITELHTVGKLLDMFSEHLAELYSYASGLEEYATEKRDLERLMRAVFQTSVDGYCIWSLDGLHMANEEFLRLLGVQNLTELDEQWEHLGFSSKEAMSHIYDEVLAEGRLRRELTLHTTAGEWLPCEVTYIPIEYHEKKCIFSYMRDMRMQKHTEEELRFAKEEAEQAAKVKSDFLARMSHEIRTPMNGVLGLAHLALEHAPPPQQKAYLEKIQASAKILLGVINDILDFSKIESGKLQLEKVCFSFSGMLSTIVDLFQGQAQTKNLRFVLEKDKDIPTFVIGDELRLSQVLLNLCGNALKFTEQGEVTLRVEIVSVKEKTFWLRFSVIDSGVGMTEKQLTGIFQAFAQADSSTTRKYGGSGLGLAIGKLLVEMMGGGIRVQSFPGKGSTFQFVIPLGKADEADIRKAENTVQKEEGKTRRDLKGLRILLVEDNEINQEIAVALLEDLGIIVQVAGNGEEAIHLLGEHDVDGIFMDIQMPVMDGLTAARCIREKGRVGIRNVPIIAMTAHAMQEDREKSLLAGMNDHITKPIDVDELRRKLETWIFPSSMPEDVSS